MKATIQNYSTLVSQHGIPEKLQKFHDELITEAMANDWAAYHADAEIAEVVDLYLEKFTQALEKQAAPIVAQVVAVSEPKPKKVKASPKPVAVKVPKVKAVKTPKAKVVRVPKVKAVRPKRVAKKRISKATKPVPNFSKVAAIRSSTRFIQRFIELTGKPVPFQVVSTLLRSLQMAILKKQVRKVSKHAEELQNIQQVLVSVCNSASSNTVQINLPNNELARLIGIAGGEKVYPSVSILKRYVKLQGKAVSKPVVERLLNDIKTAWKDSTAISSRDPLRSKVLEIKKSLAPLLKRNTSTLTVSINQQQLRGLGEILEGCACGEEKERSGIGELGDLEEIGASENSSVMTSGELMRLSYSTIGLSGKWKTFLGDPAKGFAMMIYGKPGQGKSTFALSLARTLAAENGKVLFVSSEEHGSYTLQDKLSRVGGGVPNLHFAGKLAEVSLADYQHVFIDSVQVSGLTLEDFRALKGKYPKLSIILIMQSTKEGNFKGNQEWGHEVDTIVEIQDGIAKTTKNRYKELAEMRVF